MKNAKERLFPYGSGSIDEALAMLRSQPGWPKAQVALTAAQERLGGGAERGPWQRMLDYFTEAVKAWLLLVTDGATCSAFYALLPVIEQSLYVGVLGCPPEACVARSAGAVQFQRDLCRCDARLRAQAARRASRYFRRASVGDAGRVRGASPCSGDPVILDAAASARETISAWEGPDVIARRGADREGRLQEFRQLHAGVYYADVKRTSKVYAGDFKKWRKGVMKDSSVMAQRIEAVLNGSTALVKRPKVTGS